MPQSRANNLPGVEGAQDVVNTERFPRGPVRCKDTTLEPGFLPPKWDSRSIPADQMPIIDSDPDLDSSVTPPSPEDSKCKCKCKCDQAVCCTYYLINYLPTRGWFWAAGVLLFIMLLPGWVAIWFKVSLMSISVMQFSLNSTDG